MPGAGLNAIGRAECQRLANRLRERGVAVIYSSPLQRAHDSAAILAEALSAPLQIDPDLREVDFGGWTDRSFDDLNRTVAWRAFHEQRTTSQVPGGELMLSVQARAVGCLANLAAQHPDQRLIAVSHADVIRSVVAACLGFSLDAMVRLSIDPASVTEVSLGELPPRVIRVNDTAHLVSEPSTPELAR